MKAIILSAGQGKRLSPYTDDTPKCLLDVGNGMTLLGWQLTQLAEAGVKEVLVVTGFCAVNVEKEIAKYTGIINVRTLFNPFYKIMDNLGSVWHARREMSKDFIILNGDTLFTSDVVSRLCAAEHNPVTVTISKKDSFDDDDMKVTLDGDHLVAVSKELDLNHVDAESIGMILFRDSGVDMFRDTVVDAVEQKEQTGRYYLSVIDGMAKRTDINVVDAAQDEWCEVDFPEDLEDAREAVAGWAGAESRKKVAAS